VRRALATLLLAVFSFSLISPAVFAARPDDNLPACCRRAGKHHCSSTTPAESSGPALKAAACPSWPGAFTATNQRITPFAASSQNTSTGFVDRPADPAPLAIVVSTLSKRAGQERGPPFLV
jgi:hypothetical protein